MLFNVMKAYAVMDPEVGYCQGSAFIVGMLLLNMPEEDAFCVFVKLMSRATGYSLREMYKPGMGELPGTPPLLSNSFYSVFKCYCTSLTCWSTNIAQNFTLTSKLMNFPLPRSLQNGSSHFSAQFFKKTFQFESWIYFSLRVARSYSALV